MRLTFLRGSLQVYNIEGTAQQEKKHKAQGACQAVGIV